MSRFDVEAALGIGGLVFFCIVVIAFAFGVIAGDSC